MKPSVLVTGSEGFIAGYLVQQLLDKGYHVRGIDNFSKYGKGIPRTFHGHPNYEFVEGDAKDVELLKSLVEDCEQMIAGAAIIGGISLFNALAYDLISENERLLASQFDAAIWAHSKKKLKKITVISSSMIYENTKTFPSHESHMYEIPMPLTCYGAQKVMCHYFAKGAQQQYGLPYNIAIPFNAVGTGEVAAKKDVVVESGGIKLALSHVIPDLINKVNLGQYPVHVLGDGNQIRHYTYAKDLAEGIIKVMETKEHVNEAFNLSTPYGHKVSEVLELIWKRFSDKELKIVHDDPYPDDVTCRIPDTKKAKELLGFEAKTKLEDILDEIIPFYTSDIFMNSMKNHVEQA